MYLIQCMTSIALLHASSSECLPQRLSQVGTRVYLRVNLSVTSETCMYVPFTKRIFKSAGITVSHFYSMPPSTLKYLYYVEPVRMHFPAKQPCTNDTVCNAAISIVHSIIFTRLFRGKMRSDWFNGIEILQDRWRHGEKVGYCCPSGLEKTLCKWDIYICSDGHEGVNILIVRICTVRAK
jgi:hypothetical protein